MRVFILGKLSEFIGLGFFFFSIPLNFKMYHYTQNVCLQD